MAFSEDFEKELVGWLGFDFETAQVRGLMDDATAMGQVAQHWLDGAAALGQNAKSAEEKMAAFQWRSYGRIMEAQSIIAGRMQAR